MSVVRDEQGLILPRKLANPCLTSTPVRDLHNQIKWNAKTGINVLNNKSELQRALDRHRRQKVEKEKKEEETSSLTPFQKMLADRARRLEQLEKAGGGEEGIDTGSSKNTSADRNTAGNRRPSRTEGDGLERSKTSLDLRLARSEDQSEPIRLRQPRELRGCVKVQEGSNLLLRMKSRSSWELGGSEGSCHADSWEEDSSKSRSRGSKGKNSRWEGNSSGESSKSSSPEPESEFQRVFAQLRAQRS